MHASVVVVVEAIRAHSQDSLAVFLAMCGMLVARLRGDKPMSTGVVCDAAARVHDRTVLLAELTSMLATASCWADVDAALQPRPAARADTQEFSKWMTRRSPFEFLDRSNSPDKTLADESTADSPFKPPAARIVQSGMSGDQYVCEVENAIAQQDRRALAFTDAASS